MYFTDILHKNKKICQLISGESLIVHASFEKNNSQENNSQEIKNMYTFCA
jgi:hypothetical protein